MGVAGPGAGWPGGDGRCWGTSGPRGVDAADPPRPGFHGQARSHCRETRTVNRSAAAAGRVQAQESVAGGRGTMIHWLPDVLIWLLFGWQLWYVRRWRRQHRDDASVVLLEIANLEDVTPLQAQVALDASMAV